MKKSILKTLLPPFVFAVLCITLCAQAGRAQQDTKTAVPTSTTDTQTPVAASGIITDAVYRNEYFGLQISIPQGWTVQGDAGKQKIQDRGAQLIVPRNEEEKMRFEASRDRTLNLLFISRVPLGTPNQFNANFVAAAEPVPLSTTGPTYIEQLRAVLRLARTPTSIPDDYEIETINGVEFYRLTIPVGSGEDLAQQKYYVVLRKGYAIALITTIFSESDADTMNSILKSVVIQKK